MTAGNADSMDMTAMQHHWRLAVASVLMLFLLTGVPTLADAAKKGVATAEASDSETEVDEDAGADDSPKLKDGPYQMDYVPAEALQLPAPALPPIDIYNEDWVRQRLDETGHGGEPVVRVERMFKKATLREFTASDRAVEWARRQLSHPKAVFVRSGRVTAKDILQQVNNRAFFEELSPGVFILRLPLVVEHGASLVLDGEEIKTLRLSQDRGAFIEVHGQLYTLNMEMVAWDESADTNAQYESSKEFRPFLTTWGGSKLYMSGTRVVSFGYNKSKSYGITVSHYSEDENEELRQEGPKSWIMDSEFVDVYYGFYCFEAEGLVVVRNKYINNIVYGIDPHDYSSHLVIAENEVYGTVKKHGIIVSRSVNDSWIFNNKSYDNAISGFVLDRSSERNVIANNLAYRNGGDGYTLYESHDNLFWSNLAFDNNRHGIRARNSANLRLYGNKAFRNGGFGIYGHIADLSNTDRDFEHDPYEMRVSMTIHGGNYALNARGPFHVEHPESVVLYDLDMRFPVNSYGLQLFGIFKPHQSSLLEALIKDQRAVKLHPVELARES